MSKMFVHFNGTISAFKAAGHETKYSNHIVFISGENGQGSAVFTHGEYYGDVKDALAALQSSHETLSGKVDNLKYFSKISDGTTTATTSTAEGTITIQSVDPSVTTVNVDPTGFTIGLSDEFVEKVKSYL